MGGGGGHLESMGRDEYVRVVQQMRQFTRRSRRGVSDHCDVPLVRGKPLRQKDKGLVQMSQFARAVTLVDDHFVGAGWLAAVTVKQVGEIGGT